MRVAMAYFDVLRAWNCWPPTCRKKKPRCDHWNKRGSGKRLAWLPSLTFSTARPPMIWPGTRRFCSETRCGPGLRRSKP